MIALQSPRRRPTPGGSRWLSGGAIVVAAALIAAVIVGVALAGAVVVTAVSELLVGR